MLERFRKSMRQVYTSTIAAFPRLSGAEIARLTWASQIEFYDEVPGVYRKFFTGIMADGRDFPYAVLTPSYEGFINPTTEKLMCVVGEELYILEKQGDTFTAHCYALPAISYLEMHTALLESYIKISGPTGQGSLDTVVLRFNTVTDYLFKPFQEQIRRANASFGKHAAGAPVETFDEWIHLNFKFRSYARRSLLSGEEVLQAELLPEIRRSKLNFLGRPLFYETLVPAQACILTDRELILMREEVSRVEPGKYGGTRVFIPVEKIDRVSLDPQAKDLLRLSVDLTGNNHLEFMFHATAQAKIEPLIAQFRE